MIIDETHQAGRVLHLCVQDAVAPVVLQDLNCTGTEKRLVDCPGTLEDDYLYSFSFEYTYIPDSRGIGCDPLQGTYAVVACGTEENAGAYYCE